MLVSTTKAKLFVHSICIKNIFCAQTYDAFNLCKNGSICINNIKLYVVSAYWFGCRRVSFNPWYMNVLYMYYIKESIVSNYISIMKIRIIVIHFQTIEYEHWYFIQYFYLEWYNILDMYRFFKEWKKAPVEGHCQSQICTMNLYFESLPFLLSMVLSLWDTM